MKVILFVSIILAIFFSTMTIINKVGATSIQAQHTGPSANAQWQGAMSWVRNNTTEGSLFVHWWDYGYWIQYLGERPTVTDGGHSNSYWDHLIGR